MKPLSAALRGTARWWLPGLVVLVIVAADLSLSPGRVVFGALAIVPLALAGVAGPRFVLGWGVACLVLEAALGSYDRSYSSREAFAAQVVLLIVGLAATVGGVALAQLRSAREKYLSQVQEVAQAAQEAILRPVPNEIQGHQLAVTYRGAAAQARIGGDLYDVSVMRDGLLLLMGDARGKGLPAVRLASTVLGSFRYLAGETPEPAALVEALDRAVARNGDPEDFVTCCVVLVGTDGKTVLANAGHPPPLVLVDGAVHSLDPVEPSLPLGLGADAAVTRLSLPPGSRLLLYTDGLVEACRPGTREEFPLLDRAASIIGNGSVAEALAALTAELNRWTSRALDDDVALLLVEVGSNSIGASRVAAEGAGSSRGADRGR